MQKHRTAYDADSMIVTCSCGKSIRLEFCAEQEREAEADRWAEWHKSQEESKFDWFSTDA